MTIMSQKIILVYVYILNVILNVKITDIWKPFPETETISSHCLISVDFNWK